MHSPPGDRVAAADDDDLAGHVARPRGAQPGDDRGHLLLRPGTSHRGPVAELELVAESGAARDHPGATALTVTPSRATSSAVPLASPTIAALPDA